MKSNSKRKTGRRLGAAPLLGAPKPKPLNPQPHWAVLSCNDSIGDAELILTDLGGVRLHFTVQRDGKKLSSFAVTKGEARGIIMWLAAFA